MTAAQAVAAVSFRAVARQQARTQVLACKLYKCRQTILEADVCKDLIYTKKRQFDALVVYHVNCTF